MAASGKTNNQDGTKWFVHISAGMRTLVEYQLKYCHTLIMNNDFFVKCACYEEIMKKRKANKLFNIWKKKHSQRAWNMGNLFGEIFVIIYNYIHT